MPNFKPRAGSLTVDEVGITRNLLARGGYKNQDILGLINMVRRLEARDETNGGRISEVKTNKPRYKGIKAVSDKDTDAFITRAKKPAGFKKIDIGPVSIEVLEILFPIRKGNKDRLTISETDQIECKESYSAHWTSNYIKTIAAFANNNGGYIAFGVKDNTWELKGINKSKFEGFDRKNFNQTIRHNLSCGIDVDMATLDLGGKTIGVVYVHPAKIKPAMFIKQNNKAGATEGHIYYRYQGENRLIAPAELQRIIEERIRMLSKTILSKHISNILSNGIENSAVLNLDSGVVDGKAGNFVIDEELMPKINFIKEGEFVEKSGAPTLKLIGEIKKSTKVIATQTVYGKDTHKYAPQKAAQEISKRSGRRFSVTNHTHAWKMYKVRPPTNAKLKDKVNKKYCNFDEAHGDYTYSEAWISFVVKKITSDQEYANLKAFR